MDEPLNLPRGSVRGAVTLMLTATACVIFVLGHAVPGELMTLIGVAMTFYFTERREQVRRADEAEAEAAPSAPYLPGDDPEDPPPPASF